MASGFKKKIAELLWSSPSAHQESEGHGKTEKITEKPRTDNAEPVIEPVAFVIEIDPVTLLKKDRLR